ncbi:hypothetical protein B0P06_005277 [Clostridium saccharoperbutylacetonicum]|nr:hypothetical protein [Clostridium saccharoperbutylacetonicum]NSB45506.1 hypothetical protein [Clostridium saccharoperbutylacetonicum]
MKADNNILEHIEKTSGIMGNFERLGDQHISQASVKAFYFALSMALNG